MRAAFRDAVRRGRPDLGAMSGERMTMLLAARDVLLAAAPELPPVRAAVARQSPSLARRLRSFDVAARPAAGRLVDRYA